MGFVATSAPWHRRLGVASASSCGAWELVGDGPDCHATQLLGSQRCEATGNQLLPTYPLLSTDTTRPARLFHVVHLPSRHGSIYTMIVVTTVEGASPLRVHSPGRIDLASSPGIVTLVWQLHSPRAACGVACYCQNCRRPHVAKLVLHKHGITGCDGAH